MSSAGLTIKFLQILILEFAKMVQKRYKNMYYYIQLRLITNMVQRKLPLFTYNSVRYGNNAVTAAQIQIYGTVMVSKSQLSVLLLKSTLMADT